MNNFDHTLADAGAVVESPALFDAQMAEYLADLAEVDATEAQKRELLATLWSIMAHFVQLGFSTDLCGQVLAGFNLASAALDQGVDSAIPDQAEVDSKLVPERIFE